MLNDIFNCVLSSEEGAPGGRCCCQAGPVEEDNIGLRLGTGADWADWAGGADWEAGAYCWILIWREHASRLQKNSQTITREWKNERNVIINVWSFDVPTSFFAALTYVDKEEATHILGFMAWQYETFGDLYRLYTMESLFTIFLCWQFFLLFSHFVCFLSGAHSTDAGRAVTTALPGERHRFRSEQWST